MNTKMWNIHTEFYYLALKRSIDTCMNITHGYYPPSGRKPVPLGSPHVKPITFSHPARGNH